MIIITKEEFQEIVNLVAAELYTKWERTNSTKQGIETVPEITVKAVEDMLETIADNLADWETRTPDELRVKAAVSFRYVTDFRNLFKERMEAIKNDEKS